MLHLATASGTLVSQLDGRRLVYATVPDDILDPGEGLCRGLRGSLGSETAIHLSRVLAPDTRPDDVPPPIEATDLYTTESWIVDAGWLVRGPGCEAPPLLMERLIARIDWPVDVACETTLLLARLSTASLGVAVAAEPANAEAIFGYFNRLGLPWIAVPTPHTDSEKWARLLGRLATRWCFEPGVQTQVEPVRTGFRLVLDELLNRRQTRWMYSTVDLATGIETTAQPWSPSVHAALITRSIDPDDAVLADLVAADLVWLDELRRACRGLDPQRLAALPASAVPGGLR